MKNKYDVKEVHICTFNVDKMGITPNLNDFPYMRLCVIDNENLLAIDIKHKLKYDYLETMSGLYFINGSSLKVKENKRAAIFPVVNLGLDKQDEVLAKNIINQLEKGYEFEDGNEVLSNDEYLLLVKQEYVDKNNNQKQFTKRKK